MYVYIHTYIHAYREGETKVVVELVKAGANVDMKNKVCSYACQYICGT